MTSFNFKDYLADIMVSDEAFTTLNEDAKEKYRALYIEWLELKIPQPTPGNITFDDASFFS